MTNTLPNPIPAGSVVFVPSAQPRVPKKGEYYRDGDEMCLVVIKDWAVDEPEIVYTRHTLTAPLHHLTPEMVKMADDVLDTCRAIVADVRNGELGKWSRYDCGWLDRQINKLRDELAHVLSEASPKQSGRETPPVAKEPTVREKLDVFKTTNEIRLADAIDALNARLDKAGI